MKKKANMFEINQLIAFLAVNDTHSFSLAADQLSITQPAISKRIATLEKNLGATLFDRIGRHVLLTQAGATFAPRARYILSQIQDTRREVANLSGQITGLLSIGTSHHVGLHRLPPVLSAFTHRYPDVNLDLRFTDSEQAYESALHGELELAIVTLPPTIHTQLTAQRVWRDPLVFVAGHDHPLSKRTGTTLTELTHHSAILPSKTTFTRRIVESLFNSAHGTIDIGIETNYLETNRMLVATGLGWSVIPATMLSDDIEVLDIKAADKKTTNKASQGNMIDIHESICLSRNLGVVHHTQRVLTNAALAFLATLEAQAH